MLEYICTVVTGGGAVSISEGLYKTFIKDDRYKMFLTGLGSTLILSLLAAVIGLAIGVAVCLMKVSNVPSFTVGKRRVRVVRPLAWLANAYIDVIRGTPAVVQLLIIYFIIFARSNLHSIIIAAIAFGINSGAYVAEIIRAGIFSIDPGQTEAGRSLGMSGARTMRFIVLPQAVKNILPALVNEFVVLIKETAIAGYIGISDLTKAAYSIQSLTYDYLYPLVSLAIIYYIIVKSLAVLMGRLEKNLRKSEVR
ncbi:MAG: amino acid ABC transporter permease [Clostridiales bacterium]|jgi:His/Glu/Gln/Arg/opine family amino acid ABC transporter permease subunit|nr:amino acid ABC transporter permease [Clostridiales bacterium]